MTLSDQIGQFTALRNNLTEVIGQESTETTLSKALFFISVGSNDIFDYFNTSSTVPIEKFIDSLMSAYTTHIEVSFLPSSIAHIFFKSKKGVPYNRTKDMFDGRLCTTSGHESLASLVWHQSDAVRPIDLSQKI